jgi:hypothetical protein
MPGETALPVSQYPDDFQTSQFLTNPLGTPVQHMPLMLTDRDIVVDAFKLRFATACSVSGRTGKLKWVASGAAASSAGTDITSAFPVDGAIDTNVDATVSTTGNIVPAGSMIVISFDSATLTALAGVVGTLRFRSRRQ